MIELFGFDISPILEQAGNNPFSVFWYILQHGGFIALYPVLVYMLYKYWMYYIWMNYLGKLDYCLLAIDVPKDNEQSMKAVEQIFASLSGPHQVFSFLETYWDGELQPKYSLEIASVGGYVQYFIHCESRFRDIVEASIYAQYPDAEVTEVEDYTQGLPTRYPNDDYVLWGVECIKTADDVYPIRTYKMFEHSLDSTFADPLAATLELMSALRPGENLFFQYVITPVDHHWPKRAEKIVAKIVGAKIKAKKGVVDVLTDTPLAALEFTHDIFFSDRGENSKKDDDGPPNLMLYLTPGEQAILTAVQEKITKIAYHTKFRFMYVAKEEVSRRKPIIGGVFGAVKQYNTLDMNGFKPGKHTVTRAEYMFSRQRKNWRKTKLMRNYIARENDAGEPGVILNIEELASLWHFPTIGVKAPGVAAIEAKKSAAPMGLPLEAVKKEEVEEVILAPQQPLKQAPAPPGLPTMQAPTAPAASLPADPQTTEQAPVNLPQAPVAAPATPELKDQAPGGPPSNLPIA